MVSFSLDWCTYQLVIFYELNYQLVQILEIKPRSIWTLVAWFLMRLWQLYDIFSISVLLMNNFCFYDFQYQLLLTDGDSAIIKRRCKRKRVASGWLSANFGPSRKSRKIEYQTRCLHRAWCTSTIPLHKLHFLSILSKTIFWKFTKDRPDIFNYSLKF